MRAAALCVFFGLVGRAQDIPELVKRGEAVFNKTCATGYCHALKGGTGGGAPRLAARGFDEAYLNTVTMRGLPGTAMPAFATVLPRNDVTAVVAYLATLNDIANPNLNFGPFGGGTGGPAAPPLPSDAARGRVLFTDAVRGFARCSTCHEVNGLGVAVATPISKLPADARALRAVKTSHISTATLDGETMPALMVSKGTRAVIFYDLTTPPPVLRTVDPSAVKIAEGSAWSHSSVIRSYDDTELESILTYLRAVVRP